MCETWSGHKLQTKYDLDLKPKWLTNAFCTLSQAGRQADRQGMLFTK